MTFLQYLLIESLARVYKHFNLLAHLRLCKHNGTYIITYIILSGFRQWCPWIDML